MESYGTLDKTKAEALAAHLRALNPQDQYKVAVHDHDEPHWLMRTPVNTPRNVTWGVVRYVPYCERMPHRCTGFVWHDYTKPLPPLGLLAPENKTR